MSTSMDDEENHCDLNPAKDMWYTKARVIRKWKRAYLLRSLMLKQEEEYGCSSQTVLSSQAVIYPLSHEFLVGTQKKRVDELIISGIQEPMSFVVVATIKSVVESYGWFYVACRNCNKKVLSKSEFLQNAEEVCEAILKLSGTALVCGKCEWECTSITTKFKLQIRVQDESGGVSFVIFDKDVMMIIGAAAWYIRERVLKQNNTKSLSLALSPIVENKLAFKIDVCDYSLANEYHVYQYLFRPLAPVGIIMVACWCIWRTRNDKIFSDGQARIEKIVEEIKSLSLHWIKNRSMFKSLTMNEWLSFNF